MSTPGFEAGILLMLSETKMGYFAKTNDYTPDFTKPQQVKIKMIYFMIIMHFLCHIYLFYNYASVYLGLFCVFFGGGLCGKLTKLSLLMFRFFFIHLPDYPASSSETQTPAHRFSTCIAQPC